MEEIPMRRSIRFLAGSFFGGVLLALGAAIPPALAAASSPAPLVLCTDQACCTVDRETGMIRECIRL
jgi:hypothetical protein